MIRFLSNRRLQELLRLNDEEAETKMLKNTLPLSENMRAG